MVVSRELNRDIVHGPCEAVACRPPVADIHQSLDQARVLYEEGGHAEVRIAGHSVQLISELPPGGEGGDHVATDDAVVGIRFAPHGV